MTLKESGPSNDISSINCRDIIKNDLLAESDEWPDLDGNLSFRI